MSLGVLSPQPLTESLHNNGCLRPSSWSTTWMDTHEEQPELLNNSLYSGRRLTNQALNRFFLREAPKKGGPLFIFFLATRKLLSLGCANIFGRSKLSQLSDCCSYRIVCVMKDVPPPPPPPPLPSPGAASPSDTSVTTTAAAVEGHGSLLGRKGRVFLSCWLTLSQVVHKRKQKATTRNWLR